MQVILAAIEKSDGTRKGVTDAVFSGEGITIPADESVIGKEIKIDPATGDVNAKDISDPAGHQGRQGDVRQGAAGQLTYGQARVECSVRARCYPFGSTDASAAAPSGARERRRRR